jgi:hypothetical protein
MFSNRETNWLELRPAVTASPFYASLRPHLTEKPVKMIEAERTAFVGTDVFLRLFTNEIGRIEKKWKLV